MKITLLSICIISATSLSAQIHPWESAEDADNNQPTAITTPKDRPVYEAVEQMPQFPGGDAELLKYVASHILYPENAAKNNIQGRVVVKFIIEADGSVSDVTILRGKDPELDQEAIRVVKTLPAFTPGKMNGQPVAVWYTFPVNFKLAQ